MPDILIRGLKMPVKQPVTLIIAPDGCVWFPAVNKNAFVHHVGCEAKELPSHGDLIEAEPIKRFITDGLNRKEFGYDQIQVLTEVEYAPVIVPASEEVK